jgi:hypothetical protein
LVRLLETPCRLVSKLAAYEAVVANPERDTDWKIVDVHVCRLRKLLAARGLVDAIETVWGKGYSLTAAAAERLRKGAPWDVGPPARACLRQRRDGEVAQTIFTALLSGPMRTPELRFLTGFRDVASNLATYRMRGYVACEPGDGSRIWSLTEAGRAWLAARETQGAAA